MKNFILLAGLAVVFALPGSAKAEEAAVIQIDVKEVHTADEHLSDSEKAKRICYQIAAKAEFVGNQKVSAKWYENLSGEPHVYRVSRMSTGLTCRVLVKNANKLQVGPGVQSVGCECKGPLAIGL